MRPWTWTVTVLCFALALAVTACSSGGDNGNDVAADPGTSDPGSADPGTADPGSSDPGASDPGNPPDPESDVAPDPGTTDPGTADPGTADPGTADPGTADPGTADPGTETSTLPGNFACVGSVEWPNPEVMTYTHTYKLLELLNQTAVVGATAKVCAMEDPDCATPLSTGTTDADGSVTLTFDAAPDGLYGYVEFSGDEIVTTLGFYRYTDNQLAYTSTDVFTYFVMGKTTLVALSAFASVELDVTRGHVIFSATDCDGAAAAGVSAEIMGADPGTIAAYMEGGMPNTDLVATTTDGQGGLLNVPPGTAMLSAFYQPTGDEIGSADVIVRAGAVTSTMLVPMPLWSR